MLALQCAQRFPVRPADPDSSVFAEFFPVPQPEPSQPNVPPAKANCRDYIQPTVGADKVFASRDSENVGQSPAPMTKGQNASAHLTGPFELCHLSNALIHPISVHKEIILAERLFLQQRCYDNGHFNFCPILAGCA